MEISIQGLDFAKGVIKILERWGASVGEEPEKQTVLSTPLTQTLLLVCFLGCKSIVFEDPYYDENFISVYSDYYSTVLTPPPTNLCTRVHFFAKPGLKEKTDLQDCLNDDYLGNTIIRPLKMRDIATSIPIAQVGRTLLRAPDSKSVNFVTCKEYYDVNIVGKDFKILGMPFMQQDFIVGRCAHAALWMASKYLSKRRGGIDYSVGQISNISQSRKFSGQLRPSTGLNDLQMFECLLEMGYSPVYYDKIAINGINEKFEQVVYRYVESGIPVIINSMKGKGDSKIGHSFCLIGHNYDSLLDPKKDDNKSIYTPVSFIPSFLKHDDAKGPYLHISKEEINEADSILVPLPLGVYLRGEEAEKIAEYYITDDINILATYEVAKYEMKDEGLFEKSPELYTAH